MKNTGYGSKRSPKDYALKICMFTQAYLNLCMTGRPVA